jgi:hypothetical protein
MCEAAPSPAEAKVRSPGFAFAAATRSATDFQPLDGAATSTLGEIPSMTTGAKSFTGSNGRVLCSTTCELNEEEFSRRV